MRVALTRWVTDERTVQVLSRDCEPSPLLHRGQSLGEVGHVIREVDER